MSLTPELVHDFVPDPQEIEFPRGYLKPEPLKRPITILADRLRADPQALLEEVDAGWLGTPLSSGRIEMTHRIPYRRQLIRADPVDF